MKYKPLNLGQGFPDYPPPEYVTDALMQVASDRNLHQYTRSYVSIVKRHKLVVRLWIFIGVEIFTMLLD